MRAVRVHRYHQDPQIDDIPEPTIDGPWDVIVEIGAAGVCRTDIHVTQGQWEPIQHPDLPYTIGHENAGWVKDIGSAVTNVSVGDTVIMHPIMSCGLCMPCRRGDDSHCENGLFPGLNVDGGMADLMRTNARAVVKLDSGMQPADVAALADAGLTAYHAVAKARPLLGPTCEAVMIGSGGLGHIGVQTLKAISAATVTVVDVSDQQLQLAKDSGADRIVRSDDNVVDNLKDITGGGADVVFDFVGENGTEKQGIAALRDRGYYFTIGYGGAIDVSTIEIISREINVIGNLVGTYQDLVDLMALAAAGKVELRTRTYPLDSAIQALHDLDSGNLVGRGILVPQLSS
jgi:NAD+-dependent secondary alcohol dehydrogenase Adh1